MNRYILMQAPITEGDYSSQIIIVDNSTRIGKGRIVKLIEEGYSHVGYIESDRRPQELKSGFEYDLRNRIDKARDLFNSISTMANSHVDLIL